MKILSLDIATKTGWSLPEQSGTYDLSFAHGDWGTMTAAFIDWLASMIAEHSPDQIVIEQPFMRGAHTRLLFGLVQAAHATAYRHGIPRKEYTPQAIKKFATGSHKAKKIEVVEAVRKFGFKPLEDNEADAIALRLLVEAEQ